MSYDPITLFSIGICIGAPLSVLVLDIIPGKIKKAKQKKLQAERQKAIQNGTYRYRGASLYHPTSSTKSIPPLDFRKLPK